MLTGAALAGAQGELGSPDNPIQVLFVPSVEAATIVSGGEVMAEALNAATGLTFEVSVPTSYAATIEEMCASPGNTIGFIPAAGYVIANNRCGVEVEASAVRNGWPVYWAQYVVRRDAPIYTFGDLEGKTWAGASVTSSSGYVYPASELAAAGITTRSAVWPAQVFSQMLIPSGHWPDTWIERNWANAGWPSPARDGSSCSDSTDARYGSSRPGTVRTYSWR